MTVQCRERVGALTLAVALSSSRCSHALLQLVGAVQCIQQPHAQQLQALGPGVWGKVLVQGDQGVSLPDPLLHYAPNAQGILLLEGGLEAGLSASPSSR